MSEIKSYPKKILVVDDEVCHCELIARLVLQLGHEPICVNSGVDALHVFNSNEISLIISDLQMPEMDGIELSKKIIEKNSDIPVILVTGEGSLESAREAVRISLFDYVLKPININNLTVKIKEALSAREIKLKDKKIKKRLERYQFLFDNSIEAISIVDINFNLIDYNKSMKELSLFDEEDLNGKPFKKFFLKNENFDEFHSLIESDGIISSFETIWNKANNKVVNVQIDGHTWKNEKDQKLGYQLLIKNMDQKKDLEKNLVQSEKMAALGQLVAGIAHEVYNPLGVVLSNLRYARKFCDLSFQPLLNNLSNLSDKCPEDSSLAALKVFSDFVKIANEKSTMEEMREIPSIISDSHQCAERINEIVNDLQEFARPSGEHMTYYNINIGLKAMVSILKNQVKKACKIETDFRSKSNVLCHPDNVNQAFLHIFNNAVQAVGEKGTVRIKTYEKKQNVICQISDTGCGITGDNLGRIFDPFFTTREVGQGVGLGLSIAYSSIKKIKGKIKVKSIENKGTDIFVEIPSESLQF